MAPRKQSHISPTEHDKSLVASIVLHTEPVWDSSPMKMPGWYLKLRKDAPTHDPSFDASLKRGYTTSRGKVCCVSASHAAALMDNFHLGHTNTIRRPHLIQPWRPQ